MSHTLLFRCRRRLLQVYAKLCIFAGHNGRALRTLIARRTGFHPAPHGVLIIRDHQVVRLFAPLPRWMTELWWGRSY